MYRAAWNPRLAHVNAHADSSSHNTYLCFHLTVKIAGVSRNKNRALVFRGWSRLCLHAASLSAAEGASSSATAAARAARAEAMETEATAAAEKAESLKRAAAICAELASSREQERRGVTELTRREEAAGEALRQQRRHRAKMLVRRVSAWCSLYSSPD